jgi:hypothetical protein
VESIPSREFSTELTRRVATWSSASVLQDSLDQKFQLFNFPEEARPNLRHCSRVSFPSRWCGFTAQSALFLVPRTAGITALQGVSGPDQGSIYEKGQVHQLHILLRFLVGKILLLKLKFSD